VTANNRDDSDELHDRLDGIKEKTPDFAVLHTDGGYGSEENDSKMEELGIVQIQTAIKGPGKRGGHHNYQGRGRRVRSALSRPGCRCSQDQEPL
jgi:hypothetical protein